jgi:hypothetical protein
MDLTAEHILKMGKHEASKIFSGNDKADRKSFRTLAARWHPDHCRDPKAGEVFAKLVTLRDAARDTSRQPVAQEIFTTKEGKRKAMRYLSRHETDIGLLLMGRISIGQIFEADLADIAEAELRTLTGFKFADAKMEAQMRMFLPQHKSRIDLADGRVLITHARAPGDVLLVDLIAGDGPMAPEHAAWLCSGLMNIAAWLTWAGKVHGAIGPETVMVDPETHSVRLVAGWGFATDAGTRPAILPNRSLQIAPQMAVKEQVADPALDLELIRRTVLEALGAASLSGLSGLGLPEPVRNWLMLPPGKDGIVDYENWQKALTDGWGARRFAKYIGDGVGVYNF